MEKILNCINEGVILINNKGKIIFVNEVILYKLGFKKDELIGLDINKIICRENFSNIDIINKSTLFDNKEVPIKLCAKENKKKFFRAILGECERVGDKAFYLVLNEEEQDEKYTKNDLERILDEIPYSVFVKDINGNYVYVNKKYSKAIKMDRCDILAGKDFYTWDKKDINYLREMENRVIKYKKTIFEQYELYKKVNGCSWMEVYIGPILNRKNEVKYTIGVFRDITLLKKLEQELSKSQQNILTLNSILTTAEYSEKAVLDTIKNELVDRLKADGLSIWLYDSKEGMIKPRISYGLSEDVREIIPFINLHGAEFSNNTKWPIEGILPIEDRISLNPIINKLKEKNIKYNGIYKIECNNKIIGILSTIYKEKNVEGINSDEFIKTMCSQLGMIIKNDRLSNEIKCEFNKRRIAEEELRLFLDTAVDLLAILGDDKKYIKVNSGWTDVLGWSEKDLYSIDFMEIIHPDDVELTYNYVKDLKKNKKIKGVVNRYICKNGDIKWIEWNCRYIEDREVSICTGRDITMLIEMKAQKENYEKALELERIKSEFFANISHEFKTPLNIILTTMQLILKGLDNDIDYVDKERLLKYMNFIKQNSFRLLRLVNNLIDITKIDSGFYEISLENKNIISVVEDITTSVVDYMEEKGIELIFDTEVEEEIVACDPDKIERIMLNLLSNAIKYTSNNGKIEVYIKIVDKNVVISVSDNGIGIEKEKLEHIFDRFSRVRNTLTRSCEGSGIGLSLVKSLVEMHGGTIEVESKFGFGTKFIFTIPITVINNCKKLSESKEVNTSRIEKCNIEFSDIYR